MVRTVKKPEERKKEIVETACQLFLSKGYDKTTMRDVMEQLQIAKGTIYHYFKSKDQLLDAVITQIVDEDLAKMKQLVDGAEGSALDMMEFLALHSANNHDQQTLDNLHQTDNASLHIRLLGKLVTTQALIYGKFIEQGRREGLFETDHPIECAEFILSSISFLTDVGIYPWSEEQLMRRILAIPDMTEALLKAPKGSFQFLLKLADQH